ncbi:MAG: leucyl/phenylalanyl-tRNA--protein transferase [Treponema sp.]|jgi:leucyl/phenylalanyl-tRNA--protein transferase|nr:leucyl/phenylalanyl-tRNA--protein transferase [Treponema sp.]
MTIGPDPDFPYITEADRYAFPPPENWGDSIIAVGGNLSPGMLLSAYEQGIFPWYNPEDPLLWQSPDPRFIIYPGGLHVSQSMEKLLRQKKYEISFDRDFPAVIRACSQIQRPGQGGTWITKDIIEGYTELHRLGYAHSAEARLDGELAGGCYGIRLGRCFFGESMFSGRPNSSKAAFISLARRLFEDDIAFIDCQVHTDHLESLGGVEISRTSYLKLLYKNLGMREEHWDRRGSWDSE